MISLSTDFPVWTLVALVVLTVFVFAIFTLASTGTFATG